MATLPSVTTGTLLAGQVGRVVARLGVVLARVETAWEGWTAARHLGTLDDRALADIGVTREDIDRVTRLGPGEDPTLHLSRVIASRRRAEIAGS